MADRWRREGFQAWDVLCIQGMERMQLLRLQKRDELKLERSAIADLMNEGNMEKAMVQIDDAIRIHNAGTATGILESFLNMLRTPIDMLSKRTEIPNELRTELLSLVYASSRWADVPELAAVRMAFEVIFGKQAFAEVTKEDVDAGCGVQDLLLKCLSDTPPNLCDKLAMAESIMEELGTVTWSRSDLDAAAVGAKHPMADSAHDDGSSDEDESSNPDDSAHEDSVAESPSGSDSTACSQTAHEPTSHRLPDDAVACSEFQGNASTSASLEKKHDPERIISMPKVDGQTVTLEYMPEFVKPTFINGASQRVVKELPCGPGVCVILDDTCSDSIVADTSVSDAQLVCDGALCNVTFSNVTFENCCVRVLTGARVTFNSCVFSGPTDSVSSLFVFAQDSGTQVSFTSCKFVGGAAAVAAQDAAEASITSCTFMGVRKTAVMVRGENSVLKMANSKLRRQLPKSKRAAPSSVFVDKSDFVGVAVMEKSDAQLRDIEMRDLLRGLIVEKGTATVHECSQRHVATGYTMEDNSRLVLDGCSSVASDLPVFASESFELEATNCNFRDFMVADLQSRGLYMQGPGTAVLKKCRMVGTDQGTPQVALPTSFQESYTPALVAAHGEVSLTMEKCILAKSSNCGLHVLKNFSAPVRVTACEFSEACYFGVKAAACTTEVQLIDCVMKENRQYGAGCVDATIHATRCHGSNNGWGAFHAKASGVFGESCSLVLKNCSSYRDLCGFSCEGSPDTITISPQLTLEQVLVRKSKLAGYAFKHFVRGTMTNCAAMQCGSNGIEFWGNGQANFKVSDCTSKQNLCCGVHVSEGAGVDNVVMERVICSGNKASGFENENPNCRLLLKQCESTRSVHNDLPYNSGMWGTEALFSLDNCQPPGKLSLLSQTAQPSRGNQPGSGKGRGKKPNKKKGSKKR